MGGEQASPAVHRPPLDHLRHEPAEAVNVGILTSMGRAHALE
jgi:hypothetical protein